MEIFAENKMVSFDNPSVVKDFFGRHAMIDYVLPDWVSRGFEALARTMIDVAKSSLKGNCLASFVRSFTTSGTLWEYGSIILSYTVGRGGQRVISYALNGFMSHDHSSVFNNQMTMGLTRDSRGADAEDSDEDDDGENADQRNNQDAMEAFTRLRELLLSELSRSQAQNAARASI